MKQKFDIDNIVDAKMWGSVKKSRMLSCIDPKRSVSKRKITARVNELIIKMNIKILYSNWHKRKLAPA